MRNEKETLTRKLKKRRKEKEKDRKGIQNTPLDTSMLIYNFDAPHMVQALSSKPHDSNHCS